MPEVRISLIVYMKLQTISAQIGMLSLASDL